MATHNIEALRNRDGFGNPIETGETGPSTTEAVGLAAYAAVNIVRGIPADNPKVDAPIDPDKGGLFGFGLYS